MAGGHGLGTGAARWSPAVPGAAGWVLAAADTGDKSAAGLLATKALLVLGDGCSDKLCRGRRTGRGLLTRTLRPCGVSFDGAEALALPQVGKQVAEGVLEGGVCGAGLAGRAGLRAEAVCLTGLVRRGCVGFSGVWVGPVPEAQEGKFDADGVLDGWATVVLGLVLYSSRWWSWTAGRSRGKRWLRSLRRHHGSGGLGREPPAIRLRAPQVLSGSTAD